LALKFLPQHLNTPGEVLLVETAVVVVVVVVVVAVTVFADGASGLTSRAGVLIFAAGTPAGTFWTASVAAAAATDCVSKLLLLLLSAEFELDLEVPGISDAAGTTLLLLGEPVCTTTTSCADCATLFFVSEVVLGAWSRESRRC